MVSLRVLRPFLASALLTMSLFSAAAQQPVAPAPALPAGLKPRPVPPARDLSTNAVTGRTASIPAPVPADTQPVAFRSEDQMSAADRALLAATGSGIAAAADLAAIDFLKGPWSLRQIDCPALPAHLFVRYRRDLGPGDVTEFTAAIPRAGGGRVHAIPILRRSFTTLLEPPASAVALFNRLIREEQQPAQPAWFGLAKCYAALSGSAGQPVASAAWPEGPPAAIQWQGDKAVVRIAVATIAAGPAQWELTFNRSGTLLKAEHSRIDEGKAHKIPLAGKLASHPVPPGGNLETHPIQQGSALAVHPVPKGSEPVSHPVPQN